MHELIFQISLFTLIDIQNFVAAVNSLSKDINAYAIKNEYVIDARSVFGLLSLNVSEPIIIKLCSDTEINASQIKEIMSPWIYEYDKEV